MNENQQNPDSTDLDRIHAAVKREKPDTQPGREGAPLWVFIASMAVMVLGGGYAGAYVGGFNFEQNDAFVGKPTDTRPIDLVPKEDLDPFQLAMKKGATVYNNCQGCHQMNGGGQPGLIPPLAGSDWVNKGSERLVRVVLHGLSGPVTVKGNTYNNVMPPQGHLSDKELSYVLTYVRNSWDNKADLITPEMVAKIRDEVKTHVGPWTQATLDPFKDKEIPGEAPAAPAP